MKDNEQTIRLDEILKSLFNVSKKVLIQMLNSLFKETHDLVTTAITFENGEFITSGFDTIKGDLFLKTINKTKLSHYHIELQTKNDNNMAIRMFDTNLH